MKEAKIERGIGHGCDEAALNAVKKLDFIPAAKDGKNVPAWIVFPVKFTLADTTKRPGK